MTVSGMTIPGWVVPLLFVAFVAGVSVIALAVNEVVWRLSQARRARRSVYLAWCIAHRWCPEHDCPDDNGHVLISDDPPYLRPCPGSSTRHAVTSPPYRSGIVYSSD
jgi:hypothetical protein